MSTDGNETRQLTGHPFVGPGAVETESARPTFRDTRGLGRRERFAAAFPKAAFSTFLNGLAPGSQKKTGTGTLQSTTSACPDKNRQGQKDPLPPTCFGEAMRNSERSRGRVHPNGL